MANKWKLPAELSAGLASVTSDLRNTAAEMQAEWDEASERWQSGDRGQAVSVWIESLEELGDAIDEVQVEA